MVPYMFSKPYKTSLFLNLTDIILENVNEVYCTYFFGFDKAFNSISFKILIGKLKDYLNFSKSAFKLIYS